MRAGVWKQRPAGILKRSGQLGCPSGEHRGWIRAFMRSERMFYNPHDDPARPLLSSTCQMRKLRRGCHRAAGLGFHVGGEPGVHAGHPPPGPSLTLILDPFLSEAWASRLVHAAGRLASVLLPGSDSASGRGPPASQALAVHTPSSPHDCP